MESVYFQPGDELKNQSLPGASDGVALHHGLSARAVGSGVNALHLRPSQSTETYAVRQGERYRFSFALGLDIHRGAPPSIDLQVDCGNGFEIGSINIQYGYPFQPFGLEMNAEQTQAVLEHGVRLSCSTTCENTVWVITDFASTAAESEALLPVLHCLKSDENRLSLFRKRLCSMASLQPFGWLEGCVMDALRSYALQGNNQASQALKDHWAYFLSPDGVLNYRSPRSIVFIDKIYGREGCLPFCSIDLARDSHLEAMLRAFVLNFDRGEAAQGDANDYSTEGCYTVAWPAVVVGGLLDDKELTRAASNVLRRRVDALWQYSYLNQARGDTGIPRFRNWARGIGWMLLGLVKCAPYLEDDDNYALFQSTFQSIVAWVISFPTTDGLWSCYVDDPASGSETSGSAGIAAAMAEGVALGWLTKDHLQLCAKTHRGVVECLTMDGWLSEVAQINRGGDPLQRNGYRVISQMGMGLLGSLDAMLTKIEIPR